MKILLITDVKDLGMAGEVVTVKDGYARNYLLPQKFAVMATKDALNKVEAIKADAEKVRNARLEEYRAQIAKLNAVELSFTRKADESDSLYGSVTEFDIVNALAEKGIAINRNNLVLEKHIKELGETEVTVSFGTDLNATVKVSVVKDEQ
jgi:large subunit ribosomal protein L9